MFKIKFVGNPRSIIQSLKDHPLTLTVTIPAKIVKEMAGEKSRPDSPPPSQFQNR